MDNTFTTPTMTCSLQIAAKTLTNSSSTPTNTFPTYGGVGGVNLTAIAVIITAETSTNDRTGWRAGLTPPHGRIKVRNDHTNHTTINRDAVGEDMRDWNNEK
eukprot:scaffold188720_cov45-Cyclotella_meneghiniana.AAC.1